MGAAPGAHAAVVEIVARWLGDSGEGEPEHRIVLRDLGEGALEVSEVIPLEDRTADLPYLLAGLRVGRLEDPVRRSDAQRRVVRIRLLRDR
jgi:hypothetical protein